MAILTLDQNKCVKSEWKFQINAYQPTENANQVLHSKICWILKDEKFNGVPVKTETKLVKHRQNDQLF